MDKKITTPAPIKHKWTEQEKKTNCNICLLATSMKDCKNCPFFGVHTGKVN